MPDATLLDRAAFEMWQREDYDDQTDTEAFKKIVTKAIQNELNEKEKEILYLYFYEKRTLAEIAKLFNVSIPSIWNRIKRIKRKLYGFLKYAAELYYGRDMTIAEMEM